MLCSFSSLGEFSRLRAGIFGELAAVWPQAAEARELFVALNEAVNNALFHGNGRDEGRRVTLSITREADDIVVRVKDEGGGFDYRTGRGHGSPLREAGRGLAIIRRFVDRVEFNEAGNEIVLLKRVRQVYGQ